MVICPLKTPNFLYWSLEATSGCNHLLAAIVLIVSATRLITHDKNRCQHQMNLDHDPGEAAASSYQTIFEE